MVSGLTIGDYLLWNWSLNANHDVLALVSGLTLPPLAIACAWLIVLTVMRLLARTTAARATRAQAHAEAGARKSVPAARRAARQAASTPPATPRAASTASSRASRRIAA